MYKQNQLSGLLNQLNKYTAQPKKGNFMAKIKAFNGATCDCVILQNNKNIAPIELKNIPVWQNGNVNWQLNEGDIGILLNIGINPDLLILQDFYIFLAFSQNYKQGLALYNENNSLILQKENTQLNTPKQMQINSQNMALKAQQKAEIEANEIIIKGTQPLDIKNDAGSLKSVCDSLFDAMDLLASGMSGQTTNPAAYNAGKDAIKAVISQILK